MRYQSDFFQAGKVIFVKEAVSSKGDEYVRVGVQTGTRKGDRLWLNMSKEWADGAEKGQQFEGWCRFDSDSGRARLVSQPSFIAVKVAASV